MRTVRHISLEVFHPVQQQLTSNHKDH